MTTQRLDAIDQRIVALIDSIHELRETTRQQGEILSSGIAALTEQMTEFRADMAQSTAEFRADMAQSMTEFRADMAQSRAELQANIAQSRAEFRADMADIKVTTQRQAETADRLSRIVELLLEELRQR